MSKEEAKQEEEIKAEEKEVKPAETNADVKATEDKQAASVKKVPEKKEVKKKASGKKAFDRNELKIGRRKVAISRTKMVKGSGVITINKKPLEQYFTKNTDQNKIKQPLIILGLEKEYDIHANVRGGGSTGQAEAVRMAVARCLKEVSPEYQKKMREAGFLTRDSRMVERKKYGLHKARRASQFSKR